MSQVIAKTKKGPIEYRLEGKGNVVMVLNGGHCSRLTRLSHEHLVQEGFAVLTPSRPGYDDTPPKVGKTAQAAADALATLLDMLQIKDVDLIGISAAGPTALAFAQQHSFRTRKLILESAVTLPWDKDIKRLSRLPFGPTEKLTWALIRLSLKMSRMTMIRLMLQQLTTLPIDEVMPRMSQDDLIFVQKMIESSQSGTGFVNDIGHHVDDLAGITAPVLAMYSPYDKFVPQKNAERVASDVSTCELYEVPADTHLIWIGPCRHDVWKKRLSFLKS